VPVLCVAKVQLYGPAGPVMLCGEPSAAMVRGACVHEHVRGPMPHCQYHVDSARGLLPVSRTVKGPFCWACHLIDGHECPLAFEVVSGAAAVAAAG